MAKVALAEVHKFYDEVHVVKGVSLTVEPGEFVVLLGPSGCGKSTCLRMIAGLEEVTRGDVRIGDKVVNDVRPKDRDIGMVFQSYALYPHMTVRDNLAFGLRLRKAAPDVVDKRIAEAAEMLELGDLLDRKPAKLSGGQRQRVAIGRAIVKQPAVFLFDEPLSNLDAALRVQMRSEIARLHERLRTTMVYVTHDQIEAMMLADRIAILAGGVLQQVGKPLEVYRRPANRFVADFIGSPSMNFLPIETSDGASVTCAGTTFELPGLAALGDPTSCELGVRPEDVAIADKDSDRALSGTVELVELLGWQANVHVDVAGTTMVARVNSAVGDKLERGEPVLLTFAPEACHVFDGAGESVHCGADLA